MRAVRAWTLRENRFLEGADVPVTDRGFRYGMSVFETFAVWRGALCLAEPHERRLSRAAWEAGFPFPAGLGEALKALDLAQETGSLRIYLTAGDGAPLAPCTEARCFANFEATDFPTEEQIAKGFRLGVCRVPMPSVLGGWKTGCYWPHVQALAEARREGFDEALVCNAAGAVISGAMANVFFVRHGCLQTPALATGARDGVLREWVGQRHPAEETQWTVDDLAEVEECFVTNSRIGVMPVAEIDGRALPSRQIGLALARLYREEILH